MNRKYVRTTCAQFGSIKAPHVGRDKPDSNHARTAYALRALIGGEFQTILRYLPVHTSNRMMTGHNRRRCLHPPVPMRRKHMNKQLTTAHICPPMRPFLIFYFSSPVLPPQRSSVALSSCWVTTSDCIELLRSNNQMALRKNTYIVIHPFGNNDHRMIRRQNLTQISLDNNDRLFSWP